MRRISTTAALVLVALSSSNGLVHSQEKADKTVAQPTVVAKCPVTGSPANLAISTPTADGPIFFSSKDCIATYKTEPAKFTEAVAAQRAVLAARPKIQVKCPVSGDPVDRKFSLDRDGKKVRFCSDECRKKFAAGPERYASALANSFTFQTMCPMMNEPIDPAVFIKMPDSEPIYLCCKGCDKKLAADPAKYAPDFQKQGFVFDYTKLPKDGK